MRSKDKAKRKTVAKDLTAKGAPQVKGGEKAGGDQQQYARSATITVRKAGGGQQEYL